jgi:arsenate reductase (thioredoxin)
VSSGIYNVLFLCTTNAARSIMAEAITNHAGNGRFRAFSAGSKPLGQPHPLAIELLERHNFPSLGLRSKSWNEFATPAAPQMDFVITVCDQAKGEVCPDFSGRPITAHWGIPDPAAVHGASDERLAAFRYAFSALERRIRVFMSLRLELLDRMTIKRRVDEIGTLPSDSSEKDDNQ